MTLNDLLLNNHFRGNQSYLAATLNIQRGTLKKYLPDEEGDYHFICQTGEKDGLNTYNFFTNQTSKIEVKPLSDIQDCTSDVMTADKTMVQSEKTDNMIRNIVTRKGSSK